MGDFHPTKTVYYMKTLTCQSVLIIFEVLHIRITITIIITYVPTYYKRLPQFLSQGEPNRSSNYHPPHGMLSITHDLRFHDY